MKSILIGNADDLIVEVNTTVQHDGYGDNEGVTFVSISCDYDYQDSIDLVSVKQIDKLIQLLELAKDTIK